MVSRFNDQHKKRKGNKTRVAFRFILGWLFSFLVATTMWIYLWIVTPCTILHGVTVNKKW